VSSGKVPELLGSVKADYRAGPCFALDWPRIPSTLKESRMKILRLLIALMAVATLAGFTVAGEEAKTVTVTGKIVCAKCSLQREDAKGCQNVIVAEEGGKKVEYYLVKNALAEEFGHVCKGEKNVVATGTVSEKDGHTWLDATKLDQSTS
jgi:hypothetical protein